MADILLPAVPDAMYALYVQMREAPRQTIAKGILPNIFACLASYDQLEVALADPNDTTFGAYQNAIADFHAERIALVAPYIATMQTLFGQIQTIAAGIDAASIAAGNGSVFDTQIE